MFIFGRQTEQLSCPTNSVPAAYGSGWILMNGPQPVAEGRTYSAEKDGTWSDITDISAVKVAKIVDVIAECDTADMVPIEYPEGSGVLFKITDAVLNTIVYCSVVLGLSDEDNLPEEINGGCWDNFDSTQAIPMTVGDMKALFSTGYRRAAGNYDKIKLNVVALMSKTNIEDVDNFTPTF